MIADPIADPAFQGAKGAVGRQSGRQQEGGSAGSARRGRRHASWDRCAVSRRSACRRRRVV